MTNYLNLTLTVTLPNHGAAPSKSFISFSNADRQPFPFQVTYDDPLQNLITWTTIETFTMVMQVHATKYLCAEFC